MKKVLFRGKRVDDKDWEYGYYCETENQTLCKYLIVLSYASICYGIDVISETVGQYTGLTDKNDVKIFEGDIVLWGRIKGIIVWEGHKFCIKSNLLWDFYDDDVIEVIGNIHDNPELLLK